MGSGVIVREREPDQKDEPDSSEPSDAAMACARDLLRAIEAKSVKGIADALYDAFTIMDSEPHVEGEHVEPHSYEAQNIKAKED